MVTKQDSLSKVAQDEHSPNLSYSMRLKGWYNAAQEAPID